MERLDRMTPGDILEEANLGDYIGAMGLGIAEAQEALDRNSVSQMLKFTDPLESLGGMSLIQLGLSPAFYHFRSARLSASVSMSLQVKETIDAGFSLDTGGERDVEKSKTKGIKRINSYERDISISQSESIEIHESKTGMDYIHAYSEQNTDDSTYLALAKRNYVSETLNYATAKSGTTRYSEEMDIAIVPPPGKRWGLWIINSSAQSTFSLKTQDDTPLNAASTVKDMALALLTQAQDEDLRGGILGADLTPADHEADLSKVFFNHDSYRLGEPVTDRDSLIYAPRLRALGHILEEVPSLRPVAITGRTDATGNLDYNQGLSERRANAVKEVLACFEVTASASGDGETLANNDEVTGRNIDYRRADIAVTGIPSETYYVFIESTDGNALHVATQSNSGPNDLFVTKQYSTQTSFDETQLSNGLVVTTSEDELRYITYSESSGQEIAQVDVYSRSSEGFTATQNMDSELRESIEVSDSTVNPSRKNVNSTSAVAVSVDARYSRMFDLNMSGNMSIDAELVSIPAPPEFLTFIKDYFGE